MSSEHFHHSDSIIYILRKELSFGLRYAMSFLLLLAFLILILTYFIKVPDTIDGKFILSGTDPPTALISKTNGRITSKFVRDKDAVANQQLLFVLENNADLVQINQLEQYLKDIALMIDSNKLDKPGRADKLPLTRLGEIENEYEAFRKANKSLQLALQDKDSKKIIEEKKDLFIEAYFSLKAKLETWKSFFLIASPSPGTISFNKNIFEGQQIKAGEPIAYVVRQKKQFVCEMLVSQYNFGKLKKGQSCLIKFDSYNAEEFGFLQGYIYSISDIPQEKITPQGSENFYLVQVHFKNGLKTTYNKDIDLRYGLSGTVSIVVENRRLLEKLFLDRFRSLVK